MMMTSGSGGRVVGMRCETVAEVTVVVEVAVVMVVVMAYGGEAIHAKQHEILARYPGQDDYISEYLCRL